MNENISEKMVNLLNDSINSCVVGKSYNFNGLIDDIRDASLVLMGEASHGTQEFYQARIELSKRLIIEKDFNAIAIEGDWASVIPVCQYVKGYGDGKTAEESLDEFGRFPEWMWRNTVMLPFLKWLKDYNDLIANESHKIGFYGLDLYCIDVSMQAVISYLKQHDETAAELAIQRYACFDHLDLDPQHYAYLVEHKLKAACVKEVSEQFLDMQHLASSRFKNKPEDKKDELFNALQNARLVKNAELYYRSLFESHHLSWNIRDQHMAETLNNIMVHLEDKLEKPAKIIVWAHNSHVGDARATEMSERGELNLGQIVREKFHLSSFLLGFSTYSGTVRAADHWGGLGYAKAVNSALSGSYEALFHKLKYENFVLNLREDTRLNELLKVSQLQRAIGVIYRPETERMSHYYLSRLPYQFDSLIHLDQTTAINPIVHSHSN